MITEEKRIVEEIDWRRALLVEVGGRPANHGIDPSTLRDLGIYGGQQGIWVDKRRTQSLTEDGHGLAVSMMHKGHVYPDDFDETGVIYHYPRTSRPASRDLGEIEAVKNCHRYSVPVFVITVSALGSSKRDIFFGYVTLWDDQAKLFIVEFGLAVPSEANPDVGETAFSLTVNETHAKYETDRRPGQAAFRIAVFRRYRPRCAVCDISVADVLDAAHLVPRADDGSDDPRNGIPLCALHHRAFDKALFAVNTDTYAVETKPNGPDASELGITRPDIKHLPAKPHPAALTHCWTKWLKAPRQEPIEQVETTLNDGAKGT